MPAPRVLKAGSALSALLFLVLSARLVAAPPVSPPQKPRDGLPGFFLKTGAGVPVSILYLGDSPSVAEEFRTRLAESSPGFRLTSDRFGDPLPRADLVLLEFDFYTDSAAVPSPVQVELLALSIWQSDPETDILFLNLLPPEQGTGPISVRHPYEAQLDFFADRAGIPTLTVPRTGGGKELTSLLSTIGARHQKGLFPNASQTFARRRALACETAKP